VARIEPSSVYQRAAAVVAGDLGRHLRAWLVDATPARSSSPNGRPTSLDDKPLPGKAGRHFSRPWTRSRGVDRATRKPDRWSRADPSRRPTLQDCPRRGVHGHSAALRTRCWAGPFPRSDDLRRNHIVQPPSRAV